VCCVSATVSLAFKRAGGASLRQLQRRLGAADAHAAHAALCARLADAASEAHVLAIAAEELRTFFPDASA
jgi:hypothetical protein